MSSFLCDQYHTDSFKVTTNIIKGEEFSVDRAWIISADLVGGELWLYAFGAVDVGHYAWNAVAAAFSGVWRW